MKTTRLPGIAAAFSFALMSALHAQVAGTVEPSYTGVGSPTFVPRVWATAVQPDGKLIVGGDFSTVSGEVHTNLARINSNGRPEADFTASTDWAVLASAIQPDGKILIAGDFTIVNGTPRKNLARLNMDGSLDLSFDAGTGVNDSYDSVKGIAVQPDGKVLFCGQFTTVNGMPRNHIARLNADGSLESTDTFSVSTGANGNVNCMALQDDGKILIGGLFTAINGIVRQHIARLNADGSVESTSTFDPGSGINGWPNCAAIQRDGKIVIGGTFETINGTPRKYLARLNMDGSLDASFNSGTGPNGDVNGLAIQANGKVLIVGEFILSVNGVARGGIARFNANGSLESTATFNTGTGVGPGGFGSGAGGVALQADGKIVICGGFATVNNQKHLRLARLSNDAATQNLTAPDATEVQWVRGGAAPEVSQVTFELSTDGGGTWSSLGAGTWMASAWHVHGLNLPASGSLRARGRTTSGFYNSGSGLIEAVTTFPSTPIHQWKLAHFGDNTVPDTGDPDNDGLKTLAEYGLNLLPESPSRPPATSVFTYAEGDRLRMFVPRDPAHNDIIVSVEATGDLVAGPWTALATSTLGAPFTGPGYVGGDDTTPGLKTVEVRDIVNLSATTQRWLRVKVSH